MACDALTPENVLIRLSNILGTQRYAEWELEAWIQGCIDQKWDLGMFYGYARPWWHAARNFSDIIAVLDEAEGTC